MLKNLKIITLLLASILLKIPLAKLTPYWFKKSSFDDNKFGKIILFMLNIEPKILIASLNSFALKKTQVILIKLNVINQAINYKI